jgi:hypothetical protein
VVQGRRDRHVHSRGRKSERARLGGGEVLVVRSRGELDGRTQAPGLDQR